MWWKVCSLTVVFLPYFVTNSEKMEAELQPGIPDLAIRKSSTMKDILHIPKVAQSGRPLLIIAERPGR